MKVRTIAIPIEEGCTIYGSSTLMEGLKKVGVTVDDVVELDHSLSNREVVFDACTQTKDFSLAAHDRGEFPLTIGGDHSLAIGSIASTMQVQLLHVVWIDAHTDINTVEASITKRIHGMPLATLMGEGYPELVDLCEEERLTPDDVTYLGIRSMDPFEEELVKKTGMKMHTWDEICEEGLGDVLDSMDDTIDTPIHISLDLDAMDPTIAMGVNTPVAEGFEYEDIQCILDYLFDSYHVVSMDIVEYNPVTDKNGKTGKMVKEIIEYVKERVDEYEEPDFSEPNVLSL